MRLYDGIQSADEVPGTPEGGEHVPCNLCGADDATELYRRSDFRFEVDAVAWPLVQCRHCGLAYVNPRPTVGAISRYYPKHFFARREPAVLKQRYQLQAKYLDGLPPGRLLDVGCANGDWMRLMKERGWTVEGLEPSAEAANPHGLDICHGTLESADFAPESFDVVTAWAVFEHLHDPMRAFRHVERWLKRGGHLIIVVSNIKSLASRFAYQEDIPRHLYVFSEQTLAEYARAVGLSLKTVTHDTRFFGGSGRGVVRVRLFQMLGGSPLGYFQAMKLPLAQRLRYYPLIAAAGVPLAALERILMPDWLICRLRLNGIILAMMQKPAA